MSTSTVESNTTRTLLIVLGVVVVLAGLWLFVAQPLLFGDEELAAPEPTAAAPEQDEHDEPDAVQEVAADEVVPAVTYEVFLDRDPFEPVREPVVETAAAGSDEGTQPTTTGTTNGSDGDQNGDNGGDAGNSDCQGDDEVVCDGVVLTLLDITEEDGHRVAVIQVGTTVWAVEQGAVFAQSFRLLTINDATVTVAYGDSQFNLPLDEKVAK